MKESVDRALETSNLLNKSIPHIWETIKLKQEVIRIACIQDSVVGSVRNAIRSLDSSTHNNAAYSEELAANAEQLAEQTQNLKKLTTLFTNGKSKKS
ncbi:hypothetical protein [uncultured Sunxiuqinia sp.]|uniref:hypothetical protein n=1 Tax=uncultured Sunxiuqinia sp. TaxID=1573825 RepID=UPI002AA8CD32|nr:hypothetical protein [uncultured Sunxiuqinia sp.]